LIEWAADLDLPVTVRQLDRLADQLAWRVQCVEPWRAPTGCTPKPRSGPDDARLIARHLEATFTPRPKARAER
jgi:hypothetical protein